MTRFYVNSDIGGVLVGTKDFGVCMSNGMGDGSTTVLVFNDREEFREWESEHRPVFNTSIEGSFNIYRDDCSDRNDKDVAAKLNGRYGVYYVGMTVVFEKWE